MLSGFEQTSNGRKLGNAFVKHFTAFILILLTRPCLQHLTALGVYTEAFILVAFSFFNF